MTPQLTPEPIDLEMNLPHLPAEIKSLIAAQLVKSDLKSLRYVAKDWSAHATPFLFDQVYISPYDKDLQVFANITQCPTLASSIRELIYDNSSVPELSFLEYFGDLRHEIMLFTHQPNKTFSFYSSSRRLNRFVYDITRYRTPYRREAFYESLPECAKDKIVTEGFQLWQQLIAQAQRNLEDTLHGIFYATLSAGLRRLPNLQAVKVDLNGIWTRNRYATSVDWRTLHLKNARRPYHVLGTVYSGSPLSRSWNPWHLRPKRSTYEPENSKPGSLGLIMRALLGTRKRIRRFAYENSVDEGLPGRLAYDIDEGLPAVLFSSHKITDEFPRSMAIALYQLELLELQITPSQYEVLAHGPVNALGFLPQLLKQMTSLKRLSLNLETEAALESRRDFSVPDFHEPYMSYSQVFHRQGKWPRLTNFKLIGLALEALDLWTLVTAQMPQLGRLLLRRIKLLEGRWEGILETMRWSGPWELFTLQGEFQHQGGEWWPCRPDREDLEDAALRKCMRYVVDGGRHPSLPPEWREDQAVVYMYQMFYGVSEQRLNAAIRRHAKLRQH